jgi:hypothetical protein
MNEHDERRDQRYKQNHDSPEDGQNKYIRRNVNLLCLITSMTTTVVITKLPNSEQSCKGKVKTHNYINRQNQSTTGKL